MRKAGRSLTLKSSPLIGRCLSMISRIRRALKSDGGWKVNEPDGDREIEVHTDSSLSGQRRDDVHGSRFDSACVIAEVIVCSLIRNMFRPLACLAIHAYVSGRIDPSPRAITGASDRAWSPSCHPEKSPVSARYRAVLPPRRATRRSIEVIHPACHRSTGRHPAQALQPITGRSRLPTRCAARTEDRASAQVTATAGSPR